MQTQNPLADAPPPAADIPIPAPSGGVNWWPPRRAAPALQLVPPVPKQPAEAERTAYVLGRRVGRRIGRREGYVEGWHRGALTGAIAAVAVIGAIVVIAFGAGYTSEQPTELVQRQGAST